jgi:hypothetical protein
VLEKLATQKYQQAQTKKTSRKASLSKGAGKASETSRKLLSIIKHFLFCL